ncbi:hypothetical protein [Methylobacterium dankookense]|nr:hypothetical protein [Methylobacterium dankookense]
MSRLAAVATLALIAGLPAGASAQSYTAPAGIPAATSVAGYAEAPQQRGAARSRDGSAQAATPAGAGRRGGRRPR